MPYTYVYLAGIGNSGPKHWQRLWQEQQGGLWVQHDYWDAPVASQWVEDLDKAVSGAKQPVILIAHSLGALVAAQWLNQGGQAAAAYLVAVPDVDGPQFPKEAGGFVSARTLNIDIPARVIASHDDPFGSHAHAFDAAQRWKASFWAVGHKGHINAASGMGAWPEGWQDLQKFMNGATREP